jgi:hypothetical protein
MYELDDLVGGDEPQLTIPKDQMLIIYENDKFLARVSDVTMSNCNSNFLHAIKSPKIQFVLYLDVCDPMLNIDLGDRLDIQYHEFFFSNCFITELTRRLNDRDMTMMCWMKAVANQMTRTN